MHLHTKQDVNAQEAALVLYDLYVADVMQHYLHKYVTDCLYLVC